YETAAALADDFGRWLRREPVVARAQPVARRLLFSYRRHRVATWTSIAVVLLAGTAIWAGIMLDPDRLLRQLESQLADGKPAILIGNEGFPLWQEWRLDGGAAVSRSPDGSFKLHSDRLSLLDLVKNPKCTSYEFGAQVRHEMSDKMGGVGLFLAASRTE